MKLAPRLDGASARAIPARPFLKWAGGKRQLLGAFASRYPASFNHYFEPFVGAGAVFFELVTQGRIGAGATLSDINAELIECYRVVRDDVDALLVLLAAHQEAHQRDAKAHYYAVRAEVPSDPVARAARFLYLNRTCFNGLYRVNARGQFNVPLGRYENPLIFDPDRLIPASRALQGVRIEACDFSRWLDEARPGDFFYLDPPYVPVSRTANFTSYAKQGFGLEDQQRLASFVRALVGRGCHVMLSNSDTPVVRELYEGLHIERVWARRAINSKTSRRGAVAEVIIANYTRG